VGDLLRRRGGRAQQRGTKSAAEETTATAPRNRAAAAVGRARGHGKRHPRQLRRALRLYDPKVHFQPSDPGTDG